MVVKRIVMAAVVAAAFVAPDANWDQARAQSFPNRLIKIVDSNALVVNPAIPVKTIQELIAYSRANPGKLSSGATVGIGPHVILEMLRARTGSSMAFTPYKGAAPAIADLLGNQIQIGMTSKAVLLPLIQDGKLKALAVTSDARWPELPDVPTMAESGFNGVPA